MAAMPHATTRKGSGGGFLLGMFAGLLIGLFIALGIALYLNKTPIPFMSKKAGTEDAKAGKPPALAGMPQGGTTPAAAPPPKVPAAAAAKAPDKPRFDFYKILAGGEEPVSERELRERLRTAAAPRSQVAAVSQDVYFIQAGAFQNPADADNQKARLAILGFESNVEPTNLPDRGTWYRVRLGPYTKVDELNKVRQSLAQNGIDANLVKLKDPASAKAN